MKIVTGLLFTTLLLAACTPSKKTMTMSGDDRDKHGCIHSAGYTWSEVRQECIRIFASGVKLVDTQRTDPVVAAFAVFAADSLKAELFVPGERGGVMLNRDGEEWVSKTFRVYRRDGKMVAQGEGKLFIE